MNRISPHGHSYSNSDDTSVLREANLSALIRWTNSRSVPERSHVVDAGAQNHMKRGGADLIIRGSDPPLLPPFALPLDTRTMASKELKTFTRDEVAKVRHHSAR